MKEPLEYRTPNDRFVENDAYYPDIVEFDLFYSVPRFADTKPVGDIFEATR
jgi:hypothetical protein